MRRFFLNKECLNNNRILIEGDEHNHLAFVLRLKVGESIIICFNDGFDYFCKIESITKQKTVCEIQEIKISVTETKKSVTLFQALIKPDNFELIVQKATELGVKEIIPFISSYTQITASRFNLVRLQKISKEACKQSERSKIPNIISPITFEQLLNSLSDFDAVVFANERTGIENINALSENANRIAVVIGCEGGFSNQEKQQILSKNNIISISLGKRILKAETASISALALTMFKLGEM